MKFSGISTENIPWIIPVFSVEKPYTFTENFSGFSTENFSVFSSVPSSAKPTEIFPFLFVIH